MPFYDLHINFDWDGFCEEGYSAAYIPNLLLNSAKYDSSKVNIAFVGAGNNLSGRYDLVNFIDFRVDVPLLSKIRDKRGYVEMCFSDIRQHILDGKLEKVQFFSSVLKAYKIPYIFTSGASDIYSIKSPKELAFVGELLGFNQKDVLRSMSEFAGVIASRLEKSR